MIRALEPIEGIAAMEKNRVSYSKSKKKPTYQAHELCSGPSKLCMSYQLNRDHNKYSVCDWRGMWLDGGYCDEEIRIIKCSRIGIESAGQEWASKPLRYYIFGNKSVSKRCKKSESNS